MNDHPTRRILLSRGAAGLGLSVVATHPLFAQAPAVAPLPPTPSCGDDHGPTPRQTEGPYFKPSSPERADLIEPGIAGQKIEIAGFVLTRSCRPVARALIDVWQADAGGAYDNAGFRLRGHLFSGADGRYAFRTVVPGLYPGRTRHIHVKLQPPGGRVLTTQLYFPGEAGNRRDGLYRADLVVRTAKAAVGGEGWLAGRFDFVLDLA